MNTKNTARRGFTTVELVIVIAVIAILATVLIPTFSNLIEKANLSSDKQNVRNMNICLTTEIASKIKADKPEHFGAVRKLLKEYGYGKGDNFKAKTKGYSIRWFIDDTNGEKKSVIVLVDAENKVVFPEEYKDKNIIASDVEKFYDLSLPAVTVDEFNSPDVKVNEIPLTKMYTFTADEKSKEYAEWVADFYITVELPRDEAGNIKPATLIIAGQYDVPAGGLDGYYGGWEPIIYTFERDSENDFPGGIPLLYSTKYRFFTYSFIQESVKIFNCGVVGDVAGGADQGVKLTVKLCIAESEKAPDGSFIPKEGGEKKVLGVFEYVYK